MRIPRHLLTRVSALALLATAAACATWSTRSPAAPGRSARAGERMVVTRADGGTLALRSAAVRNDTLHGEAPDRRPAMPLSDVRRAEARQARSTARVAILVVAALAAAVAAWAVVASGFQ